jgi:hypothetical protein
MCSKGNVCLIQAFYFFFGMIVGAVLLSFRAVLLSFRAGLLGFRAGLLGFRAGQFGFRTPS